MKMQAVGNPFSLQHNSSCSNKKPKIAEWGFNNGSSIYVLFDNHIARFLEPLTPGMLKYGWVCESRTMTSGLSEFLKTNHSALFNAGGYKKIFVHEKELTKLNQNFVYCPAGSNLPWTPRSEYKIYKKSKVCSLLCSAKSGLDGHNDRIAALEKFKDDPQVNIMGGVFGSPRVGFSSNLDLEWHSKKDALYDYMFTLCSENDISAGYYTEKITDCFATGTIPIYRGDPDIGQVFNKDGIIEFTDDFDTSILTKELYESKMDAIKDNLERVKNLEMADDTICRLIERLS
tara:strand:+ start:1746 stop:2609 length:864 start_codon:yes stop_codon:yes gene_type:complete